MKESNLQTSVLAYLNKLEYCRAYNLHGSIWTGSGRPDIIGSYRGVCFVIELKRPGQLPSKIQEHELCKWRQTGAIAWYATDLDMVKDMIEQIERRMRKGDTE